MEKLPIELVVAANELSCKHSVWASVNFGNSSVVKRVEETKSQGQN
jgi:hypothetical protein